MVRAGCGEKRRWPSTSRLVSRTAPVSALPARARRACGVDRRAIFISSCQSNLTRCSSARGPTSIAGSRSR
jgi:hypothetical protein